MIIKSSPMFDSVEIVKSAPLVPVFGMRLGNTRASRDNPTKFGLYVETIIRKGKLNPGKWYRLTDGNGRFWEVNPDYVIQAVEEL